MDCIVTDAIKQAREWIVGGTKSEDLSLVADHVDALRTFEADVEDDDLVAAFIDCNRLAQKWASGDTSGFKKLETLILQWCRATEVPSVDMDGNPTTQKATLVGFVRDGDGRWEVAIKWDDGQRTRESVERALELGFSLT